MGLLMTLAVGIFFLIGAFITKVVKEKKNLTNFSLGMAFTVLIILLITDIIPEAWFSFENNNIIQLICGVIFGYGLIYLLDKKVPHHDHYEETKHHHHAKHLNHIGIISAIALIIHNVIEGMSLYAVANSDIKAGILYAVGIGLHNIPFGIEITAMLENKNKNEKWIFITILTISTFIGGLILALIGGLSEMMVGILLSISVGIIIYLLCNELFIELKESFNKWSFFGLLFGILLMIVGILL